MADESRFPSEVGYKRPPEASRFRPGQSGNPKGRPKGAKNFATVFAEELTTRIVVTENGKRRTITKRQAVVKQLVNKAVAGDARAIPILLNETRVYEADARTTDAVQVFATTEDQLVMAGMLRRIREANRGSDDGARPEPSEEVTEADITLDGLKTEVDR
jgi:hypothetical protein